MSKLPSSGASETSRSTPWKLMKGDGSTPAMAPVERTAASAAANASAASLFIVPPSSRTRRVVRALAAGAVLSLGPFLAEPVARGHEVEVGVPRGRE